MSESGVLNYLKGVFSQQKPSDRYQSWLINAQPVFTEFGQDIYLSDFVNNAIDRVASEVSKIEIKSIVSKNGIISVQNDDLTRLFRYKPNPLQTTGDFLSNVEWLRRKHRNAFIYPQYERVIDGRGREFKRYLAFYPLNPSNVYVGVNDAGQAWLIKFDFSDGSSWTLPYEDIIHLRWRRGVNTVVGGGDDNGFANDTDVRRVISALDKTIQGLPKSIEASLQIKGVFHAKSAMDVKRRESERNDFESHILTSRAGIVATDLAGEFTPANISSPNIPTEAMNFLKSVIRERYGISASILSGDYNGEQHGAFYQTAIEDFIVQFEQAMTAGLFSVREQDVGHQIKCYYNKVNYLRTEDKLQLSNLAKETGIMTLNQINEMWGLEPFEGGDRRLQSLNYVNMADVDAYQKGKAGVNAE